ncbi:MAG: Rrf2 family transcriptional regulator, partial [Sedimentisphaerales bacterium]|nr:Rrf2 family transcriptional regulator [Sedimentisphaerales bacterium]
MEISNSTKYGLMAAGYIASHPKDGNIMSLTVAKEYGIPLEYLLKILQQLCKVGILQSKRGPHGGFVIGRDPSEI